MGLFSRPFAVRYRGLCDVARDARAEPALPFDALSLDHSPPADAALPPNSAEPAADAAPRQTLTLTSKIIDMLAAATNRLPRKWRVALLVPSVLAGAAAVHFSATMIFYTVQFPNPMLIQTAERAPVVRILARDGSVLAERGAAHDHMPLALIPIHVREAVIATEDRRFYDHHGVDVAGLARAVFANLRAGRFAQGGSTLTQQLAKNLFLTPERTIGRKIEELGLAFWLELRLSKSEILELYLNRVYFGGGAYGVESASQRYFDKSVRELSLSQAAILAGLLKAPSKYSPAANPGAARARGRVVLTRMLDAGVITLAEEQAAAAERVVFDTPKADRQKDPAGYAVDFILDQLPPFISGGHAEVIVETTLDSTLQRRAGELLVQMLERRGPTLAATQGAIVVLDPDGGIRAMLGGRDHAESQFNRAVKARRQPGSAFKPFVYLAALEGGLTPTSTSYDLPIKIGAWAPRNDSGQYLGEVTLIRALAQSINTVAVRLNQKFGTSKTIDAARRLGIRSDLRDDASLALGTSEVSLLELTGAYAAFGNGGYAVAPYAVRSVRLSSGRILFAREEARPKPAIGPVIAGQMNDMLNAAVTSGTGRRAALVEHPAAGKTGTTQEFRDAWFVGYTSHLTAGVWIGNDDGAPMKRAVGGGLPAELWRQVMTEAHAGKAPLALPGTVRQLPSAVDAEIAAWGAPAAADAPRVVSVRETLPWLVDNSASGRPASTPEARYPSERIDEEFLARALSGGQVNAAAASPPQKSWW